MHVSPGRALCISRHIQLFTTPVLRRGNPVENRLVDLRLAAAHPLKIISVTVSPGVLRCFSFIHLQAL